MADDFCHADPPATARKTLTALIFLAGVSIPTTALAQAPAPTMAGSVSYTALALEVTSGGGKGLSVSFGADGAIAGPVTSLLTASANFRCEGGVVWSKAAYGGAPIVLGTEPAFGPSAGGNITRVFGYNFAAPGASIPQILFNGKLAPIVGPLLNNAVDVLVPDGQNAFKNPDNPVAVAALNNKGFTSAPGGYAWLPALFASGAFVPGGQVLLQLRTDTPLSFVLFAFGGAVPGVGLPVYGIQGRLVILFPLVLVPLQPVIGNELIFGNPIPNDPGLVGISVDIQALVLTSVGSPPVGKFSNPVHIQIQSGSN